MKRSTGEQILVVGAGPTGLAFANQCLKLGVHRLRIIDKQPGPSTTSKAMGLQYRVSEVLACMGLTDRFQARSTGVLSLNMYSGPRRLLRLDMQQFGSRAGRDAFSPALMIIPQSETEAILGEALRERGGNVEWGTELLEFRQDDDKVVARLRTADGREEFVQSQWLVSCEGAHSVVRKQAGIAFAGKTYPLTFFMADVELDGAWDHAGTHVWLHPHGTFAAMPLPGRDKWRLIVELHRQAGQVRDEVNADMIRELMIERIGAAAAIRETTWTSEFRLNCRMVDRYRAGRVFLAGDSAHIHSPTGGQGIATGIQDATNLAWKLSRVLCGAPEELLDTYQEERLPKAREVLKETDRATKLFLAPSTLLRLLRDHIVLPVLRSHWAQKRMFGKFSQLHVNYRDSSLSRHEDTRKWLAGTKIRAGDRAPDVAFCDASSGRLVTLFDLLRPLRPVALIGTGPATDTARVRRVASSLRRSGVDAYFLVDSRAADIGPAGQRAQIKTCRLVDVYGDFRRSYGMTGEFLCLIRPDDHVGLFQRPINEASLDDYLQMLGPSNASDDMAQWGSSVKVRAVTT